jgi:phenylalanyl-tRNA synthetase beta chain
MKFSERWLRSVVSPAIDADALAHLLTMSGLEVESYAPVAPPTRGVVVAQVLSVEPHPNADKLTVCRVDAGNGAPLQVVCGAPNVAPGMKVPLAMVGAELPGEAKDKPLRIGAAKMRGVESQGMLCSARELGLSEDHSGLLALAADAKVGGDVREALALDDRIFEIKLTPNRADCLSVLGVAREVAALSGAPLSPPRISAVAAAISDTLPVRIEAPDLCGRFSGRIIRDVDTAALTPAWMVERLERSGQRSISALVDISNYVMLELGRPSHIFDLDKVQGSLVVRWGRRGEQVELLNGQTVEVDERVGVIADEQGVEALAGIMGGNPTAVSASTRNIFVEAAFWWPAAIQGRARRFNFTTEAGHRFERGVDFATTVAHIERITDLILAVCGGTPGPIEDQITALPERKPVRMRVARARKVIGVPIPADEMARVFRRLELEHVREGQGDDAAFVVTPPSFRFDLEIEEDLIEEVARVWGYDRIPAEPPRARANMRAEPETRRSLHVLRERLAACDYSEAVNFSFVEAEWEQDFAGNADPIRLRNPIASQLAVMRSNLVGGLVANVKYNLNRKASRVRVFEIGRTFMRNAEARGGPLAVVGVDQPMRVAAAAFGPALPEQWGAPTRGVDFFDVKADLETLIAPLVARFEAATHPALHPRRAARVSVQGRAVGWIGELHPRLVQKHELPGPVIVFELDAEPLRDVPLPAYREVTKFPPVTRDRAVLVPESVEAQTLLDVLGSARPAVVQSIELFDVYRGKGIETGLKSLAFRVVMQDTGRTLTDAEADAVMDGLTSALAAQIGAKPRG